MVRKRWAKGGSRRGGRDINGRSGTHKAREIYGKRQFMMVGKKITV